MKRAFDISKLDSSKQKCWTFDEQIKNFWKFCLVNEIETYFWQQYLPVFESVFHLRSIFVYPIVA